MGGVFPPELGFSVHLYILVEPLEIKKTDINFTSLEPVSTN